MKGIEHKFKADKALMERDFHTSHHLRERKGHDDLTQPNLSGYACP